MKIEGVDWMDWLHNIRRESEAERKRKGIDGAEWLRMISRRSRLLHKGMSKPKAHRQSAHTKQS
jgi:hypothetical protein